MIEVDFNGKELVIILGNNSWSVDYFVLGIVENSKLIKTYCDSRCMLTIGKLYEFYCCNIYKLSEFCELDLDIFNVEGKGSVYTPEKAKYGYIKIPQEMIKNLTGYNLWIFEEFLSHYFEKIKMNKQKSHGSMNTVEFDKAGADRVVSQFVRKLKSKGCLNSFGLMLEKLGVDVQEEIKGNIGGEMLVTGLNKENCEIDVSSLVKELQDKFIGQERVV